MRIASTLRRSVLGGDLGVPRALANIMQDDPSIASPPDPASGSPPPKPRPLGRSLFWAFLCCFLWAPLGSLFAYVSDFIPRPVAFVFGTHWPPVVIAAVILYPACFTKKGPLLRAFMALLAGAGLFVCTFILWILILRPPLGVGP